MINFKRFNKQYIVTINGVPHALDTLHDALVLIFAIRRVA